MDSEEQQEVGETSSFEESNYIRPSEIHSVWREWCIRAEVSLHECHWNILDAIYAADEKGHVNVRKALFYYEKDLWYLKRRASRNAIDASNFDCDDIAFYLRGKINGRAQSLGMPMSFCFGVAVIRYADIFELRRLRATSEKLAQEINLVKSGSGLLEGSIQMEHAINWLITKNSEGKASLHWVEIVAPASSSEDRLQVEKRKVKLQVGGEVQFVTPPDIIVKPLPTKPFQYGSISMIVV